MNRQTHRYCNISHRPYRPSKLEKKLCNFMLTCPRKKYQSTLLLPGQQPYYSVSDHLARRKMLKWYYPCDNSPFLHHDAYASFWELGYYLFLSFHPLLHHCSLPMTPCCHQYQSLKGRIDSEIVKILQTFLSKFGNGQLTPYSRPYNFSSAE